MDVSRNPRVAKHPCVFPANTGLLGFSLGGISIFLGYRIGVLILRNPTLCGDLYIKGPLFS